MMSLKSDNQAQVYLSQAEWSAANIRLLYYMMMEGELPRSSMDEYLVYTVMIHEFASKYECQVDFGLRYTSPGATSTAQLLLGNGGDTLRVHALNLTSPCVCIQPGAQARPATAGSIHLRKTC